MAYCCCPTACCGYSTAGAAARPVAVAPRPASAGVPRLTNAASGYAVAVAAAAAAPHRARPAGAVASAAAVSCLVRPAGEPVVLKKWAV